MNISAEGNIYSFNADIVLEAYGAFVEGTSDALIAVVSAQALDDIGRNAIEASADKLGFGRGRVAWITLGGWEDALGAADLAQLVEGLDPVALIATDGKASSLLSAAFETPFQLDSKNRAACRTVIAFNDFASMLADSESKQLAWHLLKMLKSGT